MNTLLERENVLTKRKIYTICIFTTGISIVLVLYHVLFRSNKVLPRIPAEAQAIEYIDWDRQKPIDENILALNPLRKKAGLKEISTNWKIAPSTLIIMDGPSISLVLNEHDIAVKVISSGSGWALPDPNNLTSREFDVIDGKLNGRAVTWIGKPKKLFIVESYHDNILHGPAIYFSETGDEICQCVFNDGKPWTGRILQRDGFNKVLTDVSYKEGKLHGAEKFYTNKGELYQLRTFKEGVPHGLEQRYYKDVLRHELMYNNGILRDAKYWHPNDTLREHTKYNNQGKYEGVRKMWNETGQLEIEEHYKNGKPHGWRWWKGHSLKGVWFWNGKFIGEGDEGKAEFERRDDGK